MLKAVKSILDARQDQFPPKALECKNSIFNNKHFLQSDGTAHGPHVPCSYSNFASQYFDVKALQYTTAAICWKRFRILLWKFQLTH